MNRAGKSSDARVAAPKWQLLLTGLKTLVGLSLLVFLLSRFDIEAAMVRARNANMLLIVVSFVLFGLSRLTEALRLYFLIPKCSRRLSQSIDIIFVSTFFNNFAAPIIGDGYKVFRLRKITERVDISIVIVLLERILGVAAILTLALLIMSFFPERVSRVADLVSLDETENRSLVAVMAVILVLAMIAVFHLKSRAYVKKLEDLKIWLIANVSLPNVAWALALGVVAQLLVATMVYVSLLAFGGKLDFVDNVLVMLLVYIASFVPISIGSLGVREGIIVAGFVLFGVNEPAALAAALSTRLVMYSYALAAGARWVTQRNIS